jgi:hypothetical protein
LHPTDERRILWRGENSGEMILRASNWSPIDPVTAKILELGHFARETYNEAISARDKHIAKVPVSDSIMPYTYGLVSEAT